MRLDLSLRRVRAPTKIFKNVGICGRFGKMDGSYELNDTVALILIQIREFEASTCGISYTLLKKFLNITDTKSLRALAHTSCLNFSSKITGRWNENITSFDHAAETSKAIDATKTPKNFLREIGQQILQRSLYLDMKSGIKFEWEHKTERNENLDDFDGYSLLLLSKHWYLAACLDDQTA